VLKETDALTLGVEFFEIRLKSFKDVNMILGTKKTTQKSQSPPGL